MVKLRKGKSVTLVAPVPANRKNKQVKKTNNPSKFQGNRERHMPQFVVATTDAFAEEAKGVKVPDENTSASGAAWSQDLTGLSTDATYGISVQTFRYHPGASRIAGIAASTSSWTWPSAFSGSGPVSNQSTLATTYAALRTAAWGIKITSRAAPGTLSGNVHVCLVPDVLAGSTWQYPTTINAMTGCQGYKRYPLSALVEGEIKVNGKFTDITAFRYMDPNSVDYSPTTGSGRIMATTGWLTILVMIEGDVSKTNLVDVAVIRHYEGIIGSNASAGVISPSPAIPHSPAVMAAAKFASESLDMVRIVDQTVNDKSFWNEVLDAFKTGISIANGVTTGLSYLAPILM